MVCVFFSLGPIVLNDALNVDSRVLPAEVGHEVLMVAPHALEDVKEVVHLLACHVVGLTQSVVVLLAKLHLLILHPRLAPSAVVVVAGHTGDVRKVGVVVCDIPVRVLRTLVGARTASPVVRCRAQVRMDTGSGVLLRRNRRLALLNGRQLLGLLCGDGGMGLGARRRSILCGLLCSLASKILIPPNGTLSILALANLASDLGGGVKTGTEKHLIQFWVYHFLPADSKSVFDE